MTGFNRWLIITILIVTAAGTVWAATPIQDDETRQDILNTERILEEVSPTTDTTGEVLEDGYLKYDEPKPLEAPDAVPLLIKTAISLVVIVALIYITVFLFKKSMERRGQTPGGGKLLKAVDTLYLTPNRSIYLISAAEKILVVGATDHALNLLSEITDPVLIERVKDKGATGLKKTLNFKDQLQKFSGTEIKG